MARRLEAALREIPQVKIMFPVQSNAVFAELPRPLIDGMHGKGWKFYTFIGKGGCRFMCAWDTTEEDVDAFVVDLKRLV
jgi:threonine aldolase